MAEEQKGIYKAILGVMGEIGAVGKDKNFKSSQGSYKYRGIDDVMNALHPAMVKHKVFVVPVILEQTRENRVTKNGTAMVVSICRIRYEFYAEDGSCVSAIVIGEGMDTGDKATNKAMSIAFKYACFQVFCIPTEEMCDPDAERPELEETGQGKTPAAEKGNTANQKNSGTKGQATSASDKVSEDMVKAMQREMQRTGVGQATIENMFKVQSLEEMTIDQFNRTMRKFEATPDRKG